MKHPKGFQDKIDEIGKMGQRERGVTLKIHFEIGHLVKWYSSMKLKTEIDQICKDVTPSLRDVRINYSWQTVKTAYYISQKFTRGEQVTAIEAGLTTGPPLKHFAYMPKGRKRDNEFRKLKTHGWNPAKFKTDKSTGTVNYSGGKLTLCAQNTLKEFSVLTVNLCDKPSNVVDAIMNILTHPRMTQEVLGTVISRVKDIEEGFKRNVPNDSLAEEMLATRRRLGVA